MPPIHLPLITAIKKLPNKEFMQLYLQMMDVTERYVAITEQEYIQGVFKRMQNEVADVRQLDVKLNAESDTVKAKNEVHRDIKNTFQHIKGLLKSYQLSHLDDKRVSAEYAYRRLADLIDKKWMRSIASISTVMRMLRRTIEGDVELANAMKEMSLMDSVEYLYKKEEVFDQLFLQHTKEKVTASLINKKEIRKEAAKTLKLLFDIILMNHHHSKDKVWVEMAKEVKVLAHSVTQ